MIAVPVHADHASFSIQLYKFLVDHNIHRFNQTVSFVFYETTYVISRDGSYERLAVSRATNGARFIVCIRANSNNGTVADASIFLIRHAAGAGRRGNIALVIAGYSADGSEFLIAH